MKILVVEDEPKVGAFIRKGLEEHGYQVEMAYDGLVARSLSQNNHFDLIVMDVNIPHINGFELCRQIREEDQEVKILMLTALGSTDDKLNGFEAGADDYLVKPFEFREFLARIRALSKRKGSEDGPKNILKVADLEMDLDQKTVKRSGKQIDLTAKEFSLLEFLIRNKNKVISRVDIAEKVWDIHFDTGTNVIDVYVNFLRKKIDKEYTPKLIHTQIGMGYILRDPV